MAKESTTREQILGLLKAKSCVKQDIYDNTLKTFNLLKKDAKTYIESLSAEITKKDKRVTLYFEEKSAYEFHVKIAGDILVFFMHTNIFNFDNSSLMWKTSYLREDSGRAYSGIISIYNFLSDSFKYKRSNDLGYMIARMFVNKENHFFMEGKGQFGVLYNEFQHASVSQNTIKDIIELSLLYAIDFDLYTPPFEAMQEISVEAIMEAGMIAKVQTGKRLGFQFKYRDKEIK